MLDTIILTPGIGGGGRLEAEEALRKGRRDWLKMGGGGGGGILDTAPGIGGGGGTFDIVPGIGGGGGITLFAREPPRRPPRLAGGTSPIIGGEGGITLFAREPRRGGGLDREDTPSILLGGGGRREGGGGILRPISELFCKGGEGEAADPRYLLSALREKKIF